MTRPEFKLQEVRDSPIIRELKRLVLLLVVLNIGRLMAETPKAGAGGAASPAPAVKTPRERLIQKGDLQRLQHVRSFMNKKGTVDIVNLGEITGPKLSDIAANLSRQMDSLSASTMDGRMFELVDYLENESSREDDATKRGTNLLHNSESPLPKRVRRDTLEKSLYL